MPVFTFRIESTQPTWFFCQQATHCNSGMVMVIKCVFPLLHPLFIQLTDLVSPTASQTLEQFKANAATAPIPGYGTFANLSPSSDSTGDQSVPTASTGVQGAPLAVIIGGTMGGVVVLMIVIGSMLWYQTRKRNRHPTNGRSTCTLP